MEKVIVSIFNSELCVQSFEKKVSIKLNLLSSEFCGPDSRRYKIFNLPGIQNFLIQSKSYHHGELGYKVELFWLQLENFQELDESEKYNWAKLPPIIFDTHDNIKISNFHPGDIGHFICRDTEYEDCPATFLAEMNLPMNSNESSFSKLASNVTWKITRVDFPEEYIAGKTRKYFPFSLTYSLDQIMFCGYLSKKMRNANVINRRVAVIKDSCFFNFNSVGYFDDKHIVSEQGDFLNIYTGKENEFVDNSTHAKTLFVNGNKSAYIENMQGDIVKITNYDGEILKTEEVKNTLDVYWIVCAVDDLLILKDIGIKGIENVMLLNLETGNRQILFTGKCGKLDNIRRSRIVVNTTKYKFDFSNLLLSKFDHLMPRDLLKIIVDYC
jgi:hypothetical protein